MNKNVDLTEILNGCPKGTEFYHAMYGTVRFVCLFLDSKYPIRLSLCNDKESDSELSKWGTWSEDFDGECLLFPSREQRDWSKFERFWDKPKVERFDVCTFNHFDEVLFRIEPAHVWVCGFVSHIIEDDFGKKLVWTNDGMRVHCIPFNEETKHLAGTTDDCPEYYKWWEE